MTPDLISLINHNLSILLVVFVPTLGSSHVLLHPASSFCLPLLQGSILLKLMLFSLILTTLTTHSSLGTLNLVLHTMSQLMPQMFLTTPRCKGMTKC